jgi:hypothetical protein
MPYAVTVVGEVARLRAGDSGSRNVRVNRGTPEERLLTFNRAPTYLETVPPEVEADKLLVVREVTQEEMVRAGGRLLAAAAVEPEADHPEDDEDDLEVDEVDEDSLVVTGTDDPDKVNKSNIRRPGRPLTPPARRPGRPRRAAKE